MVSISVTVALVGQKQKPAGQEEMSTQMELRGWGCPLSAVLSKSKKSILYDVITELPSFSHLPHHDLPLLKKL